MSSIPDYKLIGDVRKQRSRGKSSTNFVQRYRVLTEAKVCVVSLQTTDKATARRRAVGYVEAKLRNKQRTADSKCVEWVAVPLDRQIDDYITALKHDGKSKQHYTTLGEQPFVKLSATVSKRRRRDQQPICLSLAEIFRTYLADKPMGERIWPGTWQERATDVMSLDMKGIEKDAAEGRLTFHSLRHSFVTAAVNCVSNPQLVLEICRLSTPDLLKRYCHSRDEQLRAAVEALPSFGLPE